jgi:CHAD domain-containing protein
MGHMTLERERKYEQGGRGALPELERVPGVKEISDADQDNLKAIYFDTPDLRLARSGVTLRRREGGPDAGWHLKVPAGPDARTEHHARLGDEPDRPPAELVDLVAGILRGATLGPVAHISTARRRRRLLDGGGQVLAEVTDDRVTGQPTGSAAVDWREIEVELAEQTDAELLDKIEARLLRSGLTRSASGSKLGRVLEVEPDRPAPITRKSSAGDVVLAYLREQAEILVQQDIGVRRGAADAVHQLRVASRRTRSALRVFGKIVDRDCTRQLEEDLRWLAGKLGPARDLEVLEERFRKAVADLPDEWVLGAVNTRLTRHFTPARAKADQAARKALNTSRYFRLRDALDELLATPPLTERARRRARKELPREVGRAYRKLARRERAMADTPAGPERDTATHRVRKTAKRLRYATEAVVSAVGKPAKRTRKRAKALTKVLGEYQDGVVARIPLRQLGIAAHQAGDSSFTYGLLAGAEWAETRRLADEIEAAWQRLRTGRARSWLRG